MAEIDGLGWLDGCRSRSHGGEGERERIKLTIMAEIKLGALVFRQLCT